MVPPGDVTAGAQRLGRILTRSEQPSRSRERLLGERDADLPWEPGLHAGLDQRFREPEHVRRPRARDARDRIEQRLVDPHHDADRREDRLGPREVVVRGRAAAGDRRGTCTHEGRGVGHRSHDRGTGSEPCLEPRGRHPGRDREHTHHARLGERRACRRHVVGLDRDDSAIGGRDGVAHVDAGEHRTQRIASLGDDLDDRQLIGLRPARGEEPAEQGLAHPPTTDQEESCRHDGHG